MLPDEHAQKFIEELGDILEKYEQRKNSPAIVEMTDRVAQLESEVDQLREEIDEHIRRATVKTADEITAAAKRQQHHSEHAEAIGTAAHRLVTAIKLSNYAPKGLAENYLRSYYDDLERRKKEREREHKRGMLVFRLF